MSASSGCVGVSASPAIVGLLRARAKAVAATR
jgi:hypothetical protein